MRALSTRLLLIRACALLVLASACTTALAGKIYQWKDAKGVTHYADSPPPDQQVKDRRIDNRGAPVVESTAVGKSVENPQCTSAKLNLQILAGNTGVQQDTDGDGKPDKTLNDEDRANQRGLAEAAIKAYCTPKPAA
ncbi:DUF4124 domain-containing protein [Pseudoxanthomonas yeongjuensis]|jgi:hypothetical protein|uniref:DUF4124 domain-containing protein n=1 Tax=Pseudoxanthomonas yeongjuensis TaxID=377616 RepID=UPI001390B608|nr:DUF4124 domain-containing protein [Pseudoxanthomonas yeongjuensis]KAF1715910.1 DUF4124 domain-containing protein [Pseudoxanthomonas yeongjuensis]